MKIYTQEREFTWDDVGEYWHFIYWMVKWQHEWERQQAAQCSRERSDDRIYHNWNAMSSAFTRTTFTPDTTAVARFTCPWCQRYGRECTCGYVQQRGH